MERPMRAAREVTTGRCLCGDIRFEYRGAPLETGYCHCESCRRSTSQPFVAYVVIDKSSFRYARGTPVGYASSPGVERTHCGRCGSPISFENSKDFALWVGALDDPTKVTPTYHCHTAEQLPWVEITDELPRYEFRSHKATPLSYGPSGRSGR
jgi:hypothetical protein